MPVARTSNTEITEVRAGLPVTSHCGERLQHVLVSCENGPWFLVNRLHPACYCSMVHICMAPTSPTLAGWSCASTAAEFYQVPYDFSP